MNQSYEIELLNQKIQLKTDNSEKRVKQMTEYVNKIFLEIKNSSQTESSQNIAILAALNIADKLFQQKEQTVGLIENWTQRLLSVQDKLPSDELL